MLTVLGVYYTLIILHPQRGVLGDSTIKDEGDNSVAERAEESGEAEESDTSGADELCGRVIAYCRQHYLEPHLTRRDIVALFDYGQRTLAGRIISEYGFYNMINTLRLEHARQYTEAHPLETKESVAVNSGFKDRFAMRHAERKIGHGIPDLLAGFSPQLQ